MKHRGDIVLHEREKQEENHKALGSQYMWKQ